MTESMPTILQNIVAEKQREIAIRREQTAIEIIENLIVEQQDFSRDFYNALKKKSSSGHLQLLQKLQLQQVVRL